jgi:hypothetical protein
MILYIVNEHIFNIKLNITLNSHEIFINQNTQTSTEHYIQIRIPINVKEINRLMKAFKSPTKFHKS